MKTHVFLAALLLGMSGCQGMISKPPLAAGRYLVNGDCMVPALPAGLSFVTLDPGVRIEEIRPGTDLVASWRPASGTWEIHRAVGLGRAANGEWFLETKGDRNPERDRDVTTAAHFLGRVTPDPTAPKIDLRPSG